MGVSRLSDDTPAAAPLDPADVAVEAMRAGGLGGQRQTVTESAVRASDRPAGMSVVCREGRSRHRNRAEAMLRLALMVAQRSHLARMAQDRAIQAEHDRLTRGSPVRTV